MWLSPRALALYNLFFSLLLADFAVADHYPLSHIVINEVMAVNSGFVSDEDGDYSDWIEVRNPLEQPVDLGGYRLRDKKKSWVFPQITIAPNSYLLVFASGKDRRGSELHTNFRISKFGEKLSLLSPQKVLIDQIETKSAFSGVSFGRSHSDQRSWSYFDVPSPGAKNLKNGFRGVLAEPEFTPRGGIFGTSRVTVSITGEAGEVRYTLDGSEPTRESSLYQGPIALEKSSVIRAKVFKDGWSSGMGSTQTYLIDEPQGDLPLISITAVPEHLYNSEDGLFRTENVKLEADPGGDREIPMHLEFFDRKGGGFRLAGGMRLHGNISAMLPQHALAIFARKKYGPGKIRYRIFPDRSEDEYESFILRNGSQDFGGSRLRDVLMSTVTADMDVDRQAYRPAEVYINGKYWGIYHLREKLNEHYLASLYDLSPKNIDMAEFTGERIREPSDSAGVDSVVDLLTPPDLVKEERVWNLSPAAFRELHGNLDHLYKIDSELLSGSDGLSEQYKELWHQYFEHTNFFDYVTANIYAANVDWVGRNIHMWRPRTDEGRWRWMLFDLDLSLSPDQLHVASIARGENVPFSLLGDLTKVKQFHIDLCNAIAYHLNVTFEPTRVLSILDSLGREIEDEMPRHINRWKESESQLKSIQSLQSFNDWQAELEILRSFVRERPKMLRERVVNELGLAGSVRYTFGLEPPNGGELTIAGRPIELVDGEWQGQFFSEIPLPVVAAPRPGYVFHGWEMPARKLGDQGMFSGAKLTLNSLKDLSVVARFRKLPLNEVVEVSVGASVDGDLHLTVSESKGSY